MNVIRELGLIQVYTGEGKGKTTAALGLGLRAAGHGFRVHMIQFMKGRGYTGELIAVKNLAPNFTLAQFGRECRISSLIRDGHKKCEGCGDCFVKDRGAAKEDVELARKGLQQAWEYVNNKGCDILILDEIGNALRYGLVTTDQVMELIEKKPREMELVLTGRGVPQEIFAAADLVTEMKEIKHPYKNGVSSRRGIEY